MKIHVDPVRALRACEDVQRVDSPSLVTLESEILHTSNICALKEMRRLQDEIEEEQRAGDEEMIQMELDVGEKFLDESDHLKAESDYLKAEMILQQQETLLEVIACRMDRLLQDDNHHSKQWQEQFQEEIKQTKIEEEKRTETIQRIILQTEADDLLKKLDNLKAKSDCRLILQQQETLLEVIACSMDRLLQDDNHHSKQWQEQFQEEIEEEKRTETIQRIILQTEADDLRKKSDNLKAKSDCRFTKDARETAQSMRRGRVQPLHSTRVYPVNSTRNDAPAAPNGCTKLPRTTWSRYTKESEIELGRLHKPSHKGLRNNAQLDPRTSLQRSHTQSCTEALPVLLGRERNLSLNKIPCKAAKQRESQFHPQEGAANMDQQHRNA